MRAVSSLLGPEEHGCWCARRSPLARARVLIVALFALLSATASATDSVVSGPQTYNGTGRPALSIKSFSVPQGGSGYTLRVTNHGVFAAVIVLNGRLVLWPPDLLDPPGLPCREDSPWQPEWDRIQREWRSDKSVRTRSLIEKPVLLRNGRNDIIVAFIARTGASFTVEILKRNTDTTPPVITTTTAPSPNSNGWNNTNATVTFSCSDTGSGIATCPAPVTISAEGAGQLVSRTATDKAGNTATASARLNIDKTRPIVGSTVSPIANAAGWNNGPVTVSFTATDTLSGIAPGTLTAPSIVSVDGANLSASGQATDLAGNSGSTTRSGINIDTVKPTVRATLSPAANVNGWNNTPVTAHFSCADSGSGVAACSPDQLLSSEGAQQTIVGSATDKAGNSASATSPSFSIDTTVPLIAVSLSGPGNNGLYAGAVTAHFTCSDGGSGVASCPPDRVVETVGPNQTVVGTATDRAGNTASVTSAPFTVVPGVPTITLIVTPPANAHGWRNVAITAHFTCLEAGAPLPGCPTDRLISTEGANQTVSGSVTDTFGQSASVTSEPFSIDLSAPSIAAAATPAANAAGWNTTDVTVAFTCADGGSGIASCPSPSLVSEEGAGQAVSGLATDNAGNTATITTTINVDKTAPAAEFAIAPPASVVPGAPITFSVNAADNIGIASVAVSVNGAPSVRARRHRSTSVCRWRKTPHRARTWSSSPLSRIWPGTRR